MMFTRFSLTSPLLILAASTFAIEVHFLIFVPGAALFVHYPHICIILTMPTSTPTQALCIILTMCII